MYMLRTKQRQNRQTDEQTTGEIDNDKVTGKNGTNTLLPPGK